VPLTLMKINKEAIRGVDGNVKFFDSYLCDRRHSHGGTGFLSCHSPSLSALALSSAWV
jgi:hypothetical protein